MAATPAGRRYLVQVPGSAQSRLSDAELAEVLNWMIGNLSEVPAPRRFARFTAAEVASYRHEPLVAVAAARQQLMRVLGQ